MKNSTLGMSLLRHLANQGLRIFSTAQAQAAGSEIGMNPDYVSEALHHLKNGGWVTRLKRGVYAIAAYGEILSKVVFWPPSIPPDFPL